MSGNGLIPTPRHDGFTPERRKLFKQTLRETGCVRDACRVAGISDSAAYKARANDPGFAAEWESALAMAAGDYELLAWQRGVEGIEEDVWAYGKLVGTRVKRDDRIFRLLLQGSNPDRFGGPARHNAAALRRRLRREVEDELRHEENIRLTEENAEKLAWREINTILKRQMDKLMCEGGYYFDVNPSNGQRFVIPKGYVWTGEGVVPPASAAAQPGASPRQASPPPPAQDAISSRDGKSPPYDGKMS